MRNRYTALATVAAVALALTACSSGTPSAVVTDEAEVKAS